MDVIYCLVSSWLGRLAYTQLQTKTPLFTLLPAASRLAIFLSLFFIQYSLLIFYRLYIYPNYLSPFRHLPGPKVTSYPRPPLVPKQRTTIPHT